MKKRKSPPQVTKKNLEGQRFGSLVVGSLAGFRAVGSAGRHRAFWVCRCDCGTVKELPTSSLTTGNTSSCGCLRKAQLAARNRSSIAASVGMAMKDHPLFPVWNGMHARCANRQASGYEYYGGRSVSVCGRWSSFEAFVNDMGSRPEGTTLDRIDTDGDYEPGNCRWATIEVQSRNRRNNRMLTIDGRTMCVTDWAAEVGLDKSVVRSRLGRGWAPRDAVFQPIDRGRPLCRR